MLPPRMRSLADARLARDTDPAHAELVRETATALTELVRRIVCDWVAVRIRKQAVLRAAMKEAAHTGDTTLKDFLEQRENLLPERTQVIVDSLEEAAATPIPPWMETEIRTHTAMKPRAMATAQSFLAQLVAVLPPWLRVQTPDDRPLETIITEIVALRMRYLQTAGTPIDSILLAAQQIERDVTSLGEIAARAGISRDEEGVQGEQSKERFNATLNLLNRLGI